MKKIALMFLVLSAGSMIAMERARTFFSRQNDQQSRQAKVMDYVWLVVDFAKLDWCENQLGYAAQVVAKKYGIAEDVMVREIKKRVDLGPNSDQKIRRGIRGGCNLCAAGTAMCCFVECPCVAIPVVTSTFLVGRKVYDMKQHGLSKKHD